MKAKLLLLTLLSLVVFGCSPDDGGIEEKKVTITFVNKEKQVLMNDSFDLINELKLENTTKEQVVWLSDNPKVVHLNGSLAKALSEGETKITAKVKNTAIQASMKISVQEQILQFKQKELSLVTNKTINLYDLLEIKNIELKQLKWTVEKSDIISVSQGKLTTSKEGRSKVTVEFGKAKAQILVIVEKDELQDLIFEGDTIDIIGMRPNKIPYRTIPEGASTKEVKWELSHSSIQLLDGEILYSNRLTNCMLTAILPNGKRKTVEVRVVSKGIMEIRAPYGTSMRIEEGQSDQFFFYLFPLGETFEDLEVTIDNPIIEINHFGSIKTFMGKTGVTYVKLQSKQNPEVSIIMKVEVVSFIYDVWVNSDIFDEIITGNGDYYTGELYYQLYCYRRQGVSVKDFVLYDGYKNVIFRDANSYNLEQIYVIDLNKVYKPYAEFTLTYEGVSVRCRKEVKVVSEVPIQISD